MKKLGIMANCSKPRAAEVLRALSENAVEMGLQLFSDKATAKFMKSCKIVSQGRMFEVVDAVIALGGDGTMLRAVRALAGKDKPVLGVNIGSLGFMTSVAEKDIGRALDCLVSNKFSISVRAVIDAVVVRRGKAVAHYRALNDVVLDRGPSSRIMTLEVAIDGDYVTSYSCDGLIVSTPTGSTGHSLSAGGPIVAPESRALVISVICPHTLSSRPLVIPDQGEIAITATEIVGAFLLSVDGQTGQSLKQGDCIKVKRSDKSVRFIHLPGYSYFSVLRKKLHWRGSSI
jgi:NAD+ kinase